MLRLALAARKLPRMVHLGSRYYGIGVKICLEFLLMVKRGMVIRVAVGELGIWVYQAVGGSLKMGNGALGACG